MTHMHVAGSIHADATTPAPHWLRLPDDVNALTRQLWSKNASRNAEGELQIAGRTAASIVNEVGSPVYVIDEDDFRTRARQWRDAFAGWAVYYAGKSFLCTGVARWIAEEGLGLDVCTGGELAVALRGESTRAGSACTATIRARTSCAPPWSRASGGSSSTRPTRSPGWSSCAPSWAPSPR